MCAGLIPVVGLGMWQMSVGWSPASSWLGLASRSAEHLGDSVLVIEGKRILRMYGSFPHPNIFGTVIALIFGVMASLSFQPPFAEGFGVGEIFKNPEQESRRFLTAFGMTQTSQLVIIPMLIVAVLFCISRSAALAMACAFITYLGFSYKNIFQRRTLFSIALFLPVLIWTLQFISPSLIALRGQSFTEQQSISERVAQVGEWWQVMEQNGVWGTGIYQYPQVLADIQGVSLPAWVYQPVHNVFLLVIAELGLFWCGVVGVGLLIVIKTKDSRQQTADKRYITSVVCRLPSAVLSPQSLPLLITIYSLSWFDHALWTSWSGMSYTATAIALVFAGGQSRISTLSQGVLDEKK
ncbi:MAG: O-antigen ligase family protein [Patescibacteria group bacterium]